MVQCRLVGAGRVLRLVGYCLLEGMGGGGDWDGDEKGVAREREGL